MIELRSIFISDEAQRLGEQIVFALEVQVDDALGEAGLTRDIAQRRTAHTLFSDALDRRVNKLLTSFFPRRRTSRVRCYYQGHRGFSK
jgi:hypothetical protein